MSDVMTEKAAVVDEVKTKVDESSAAVVAEYRGMTVAQISTLRRSLKESGAEFKVFKNTLVKRAIAGTESEPMGEFLQGPTAIAFVSGDVSAVAKKLRDFSKEVPTLVVKGGVLEGKAITVKDILALADLPSREVLLSQFAGLLASPMRQMAGLIKAVPQNLAYGLSALIDSRGGAPATPEKSEEAEAAAPAEAEAEAPAAEATAEEAPADSVTADAEEPVETTGDEAPAAE